MKISSTRSFFFMQIKVIFIRMVSHLDSRALKQRHKGTRKWPIRKLTRVGGLPYLNFLKGKKLIRLSG